MLTVPIMGAGGSNTPKSLRPFLDVKLVANWRYADARGIFVFSTGEEFSPTRDLPKGAQVRYMVPNLAKAERTTLSADEADLAQYVQIIFPKGTVVDPYLDIIRNWPCVELVQTSPNISLP